MYLKPLLWVSERYLQYNPMFIYEGRKPLLHQTEVVAKSLFIKPTRMLVADVIGLGKTITALRLLKTIGRYRRLGRVLIAAPSVLVTQWIDEMKSMNVNPVLIDRKNLGHLTKYLELPSGWYVGSIDTIKQPEYMAILKKSSWDAIVVDEAHKLSVIGSEPNMRWQNLGGLIRENKDAVVLLLSATPHRGKPNDYLSRLALIDPSLLDVTNVTALEKVFDKPEFYTHTHNVILFRRNKDDVNLVYERIEIFKPANMLAVLIEPNESERTLLRSITDLATSYLGNYYAYMIEELGWKTGRAQGIVSLLRTLLVKRGLSSPQALVKTFSKLVEKRGRYIELIEKGYNPDKAEEKIAKELEEYSKRIDDILTGDIEDIEELDDEFDKMASYFDKLLDERFREKLEEAKRHAEAILKGEVPDSKLETLKRILTLTLNATPGELSDEFMDLASGKAIVFTEFKDTANYIYKRLRKWAEEEFGDPDIVKKFTSDDRGSIDDIKKWLSEEGRRVLVTTDVAGEGLNLQYANVLINYEIAWSPIRLEQRIGRVWRYGQKRTTYVFNLFLADALEKEVAEVVFGKLYGISISVGKLEPILGEKVFLSTIRNEVLEHAVEESEPVGGLIPVEIDFKDKKISLSEAKIIDLVTRDAQGFVKAFIRSLKKLVQEIKRMRVYPPKANAERIREELQNLTGFRDTEDAVRTLEILVEIFAEVTGSSFEVREDRVFLRTAEGKIYELPTGNPEEFLKRIVGYFQVEDYSKYFVYQDERREVLLLSEAEVIIDGEVRYREPIGVSVDFGKRDITIMRGRTLVTKLSEILSRSIPVDEIYGLDDVMDSIPDILSASNNTFYEKGLRRGAVKVIELLKGYEDIKAKLKGGKFFAASDPQVKISEPVFIMISTAFLPEVEEIPSDEVWGWAEDRAMPVVFNYEGLNGREAMRVSGHEHYDVRSVRREKDKWVREERFIEVKTKMKRSLGVGLKKEEFRLARELGDRYWLYLVYGVGSDHPVILCIRNPVKRLSFRRKEVLEKREGYYFGITEE